MNAQLEWFKDYYQQVVSLAGEQNGDDIIRTALYAIGTGTNDYLNNYFFNPVLMANYSLDQYQAFLLGNAKGYIQVCSRFLHKQWSRAFSGTLLTSAKPQSHRVSRSDFSNVSIQAKTSSHKVCCGTCYIGTEALQSWWSEYRRPGFAAIRLLAIADRLARLVARHGGQLRMCHRAQQRGCCLQLRIASANQWDEAQHAGIKIVLCRHLFPSLHSLP